jgi:predicted O-methyltransferase YrrM
MVHHSDFIGLLASIYKPNTYVELGLYEGETLQKVIPHAQNIYGVDLKNNSYLINLKSQYPNINLIFDYTDNFFKDFNTGIDMIFIDADHCFESVKMDFENALERLNPGGIIILHDTDPDSDSLFPSVWCGDSYKIVEFIEKKDDLNIVTIPIESPGLSIITKKNNTRVYLRHHT